MAKQPNKKQEVGTTGHSWDGIEELNNPLPRWWLWTFYICIIYGIGYSIAYPAWPGINSATAGFLGFSTRGQVATEIAQAEAKLAPMNEKLASVELTDISADAELNGYAQSAGAAVFKTWCAQCHGDGAAGAKGYPNLRDDDWLWGGAIEDIHFTIAHGIRNEDDPEEEARLSAMPAFGKDEILSKEEIGQVVNYVMTLAPGGTPADAGQVEAGAVLYADNCASCHMEDGTGDRAQGAPNLADAIWLYGGDYDTITETVTNARYGVMPNWNTRLSEAEIRAVATYVHSLGGGE